MRRKAASFRKQWAPPFSWRLAFTPMPIPAEPLPASEFESVEEARTLQDRLLTISEKVAPAVVALTYHDIANDLHSKEGTGIVVMHQV